MLKSYVAPRLHKIVSLRILPPWDTLLFWGLKTIEARPANVTLNVDDEVLVNDSLHCFVERVTHYPLVAPLLHAEGADNVYPGQTAEQGVLLFRERYSEAAEKQHGVLAIKLRFSRPS